MGGVSQYLPPRREENRSSHAHGTLMRDELLAAPAGPDLLPILVALPAVIGVLVDVDDGFRLLRPQDGTRRRPGQGAYGGAEELAT